MLPVAAARLAPASEKRSTSYAPSNLLNLLVAAAALNLHLINPHRIGNNYASTCEVTP
jgi:hypothetical protein